MKGAFVRCLAPLRFAGYNGFDMKKVVLSIMLLLSVAASAFAEIMPNHSIYVDLHPLSACLSVDYHLLFSVKDDETDSSSDESGLIGESVLPSEFGLPGGNGIQSGGEQPFSNYFFPYDNPYRRRNENRTKNYLGLKMGVGAGVRDMLGEGWYFRIGVADRLQVSSFFSFLFSVNYMTSFKWFSSRLDLSAMFYAADNIRISVGISFPLLIRRPYSSSDSDEDFWETFGLVFTEYADIPSIGIEFDL
ncbi:MAG TPA: hypothetical protein DCO86_02085 [Spirochaetaceae bacterium]|nr:hypothetical protein [Spirochaetaceae bacterium]